MSFPVTVEVAANAGRPRTITIADAEISANSFFMGASIPSKYATAVCLYASHQDGVNGRCALHIIGRARMTPLSPALDRVRPRATDSSGTAARSIARAA